MMNKDVLVLCSFFQLDEKLMAYFKVLMKVMPRSCKLHRYDYTSPGQ